MLGSLVALDTLLFYVFWEVMLVPMYFIIGIWGGKRRIYATMKFFLFTMAGSLLMFVAILYAANVHLRATGFQSLLARRVDAGGVLRRLEPFAGHRGASLRRVHARFPREGAALAAPHVASGRPRRGSDGRLDHPRGRPPEARDVRPPALRVSAVSACRGPVRPASRRARARGHRLRGLGRRGAEGHEEARRVLVREPPRARRPRHRRGHGRRALGRGLPDGRPRTHDRPAVPPRGRPVLPPAHARDGRLRRHRGARPRDDRALPHRDARLDRAARPERVHRRVPDPRRRVPGEGRLGRDRRHRHGPRRDLPPHARPEGVLGPRDRPGEPLPHGHQRLGAGGRVSPRRPHRPPRRLSEAAPHARGRQRQDPAAGERAGHRGDRHPSCLQGGRRAPRGARAAGAPRGAPDERLPAGHRRGRRRAWRPRSSSPFSPR